MKILLVDDSTLILDRLHRLLAEVKFVNTIHSVKKIADAVSELSEFQPDVVVLDIRLSDGNGLDFLREIKKSQNSPEIIVLTNFGNKLYRKSALDLGATYFFEKSKEFNLIRDAVIDLHQNAQRETRLLR